MSTSDVVIPFGDRSMRGIAAIPDGTGPHPGMIVIHELWGLNDDIRRITERFAAAGYAAVAPDLYSPGFKPACVARTIRALATNGTAPVDQAEAARAWLVARPDVDTDRVGAIGFCMGGGFALALALRGGLGAVSVNYGPVAADAADLAGVCPVVASYGADDRRFAPEGRRLEQLLRDVGVEHDVKFYDGAVHSFMNDAHHPVLQRVMRPVMAFAYHPAAADDAWGRVFGFFATHLRADE